MQADEIGAAIRLVASADAVPSDRNTKQFVEEHTVPATRQRPTHHVELQAAIRRHDAPKSLGVERGQVLELTRRRVIGELARRLPVLCVHQVRVLERREARKRVFELGMRRAHAPKIGPGRTTQLPSSSPPIAMRSTRTGRLSTGHRVHRLPGRRDGIVLTAWAPNASGTGDREPPRIQEEPLSIDALLAATLRSSH